MFCPRCGMPLTQGANFCAKCGQQIMQVPAPAPTPARETSGPHAAAPQIPVAAGYPQGAMPYAQPRKSKAIWWVLGTMLAVAAILLGIFATGAFSQTAVQPETKALRVEKEPPPPALQKEATVPEGMPDNVRDWLEHLRRIERRKNELHNRTAAQMRVFMAALPGEVLKPFLEEANGIQDPVDPTDDSNPRTVTSQKIQDLSPEWEQLLTDFRSVPPPTECQELADAFDRALSEVPASVKDVYEIISSVQDYSQDTASKALEKLYALQGGSASNIDDHFREADIKLGDVCARYNTPKWFSISSDLPGGSLSKPGF